MPGKHFFNIGDFYKGMKDNIKQFKMDTIAKCVFEFIRGENTLVLAVLPIGYQGDINENSLANVVCSGMEETD